MRTVYKKHPKYYKMNVPAYRNIINHLDDSEIVVYNYLIDNMDLQTNTTVGNYSQIMQNTNTNKATFSALTKLAYLGYIKHYKDITFINPNLIYKGPKEKKAYLSNLYYNVSN